MIRLVSLALCLILAVPVQAHREPESLTYISWNESTGFFEVEHRIHQHEAQSLLTKNGSSADDLASLENRARIALWVSEVFNLKNKQGLPISVSTVGAELDADHIIVLQEFKSPRGESVEVYLGLHRVFKLDHVSRLILSNTRGNNTFRYDRATEVHTITLP